MRIGVSGSLHFMSATLGGKKPPKENMAAAMAEYGYVKRITDQHGSRWLVDLHCARKTDGLGLESLGEYGSHRIKME